MANAKATDHIIKKANIEKTKEKKKAKVEKIQSHNMHNIAVGVLRALIPLVENRNSECGALSNPLVPTIAAVSVTKQGKLRPRGKKNQRAPKQARSAYDFSCTKMFVHVKHDAIKGYEMLIWWGQYGSLCRGRR